MVSCIPPPPPTCHERNRGFFQVISCIGAPESEILNSSAPRRIDGEGAIRLVQAAARVGVSQFVMVTSLGTGKFGWPAGEVLRGRVRGGVRGIIVRSD